MNTIGKTEEELYNDLMQELDELPDIPNYTLDRDALWKRLQVKMAATERKKRNKRSAMYWSSAAASVLLILSLFFMANKPKDPRLIGKDAKTENPVNKTNSPSLIAKDPVIKNGEAADLVPAKSLAIKPPGTVKVNQTAITPTNDKGVAPGPMYDVTPLPVLITDVVKPFYFEQANANVKRKGQVVTSPPSKYGGGMIINMEEAFLEQTGVALFKNP